MAIIQDMLDTEATTHTVSYLVKFKKNLQQEKSQRREKSQLQKKNQLQRKNLQQKKSQ